MWRDVFRALSPCLERQAVEREAWVVAVRSSPEDTEDVVGRLPEPQKDSSPPRTGEGPRRFESWHCCWNELKDSFPMLGLC